MLSSTPRQPGAVVGLLVVLGLLVAGLLTAPAAARAAPAPSGDQRTVLIGAPGLSWSDIDRERTPAIAALAAQGADAALTVRAVRSRSCTIDGWLTLSAGRRAADLPGECRVPAPVVDGSVPRWSQYLAAAAAESYDAVPGTVAAQLGAAGVCIEGIGPGAAIGAATPAGKVAHYGTDLPSAFSCPVVFVDGGTLPPLDAGRVDALATLDTLVAQVHDIDPTARLVVAGIADGDSSVAPRAILVSGPGVPSGTLTSPSTRQPGLIQLQDLSATLVQDAGGDIASLTGRPISVVPESTSGQARLDALAGFERRAFAMREISPTLTMALAIAFALWALLSGLRLLRGEGLPMWLLGAGTVVASAPAATFAANLVPWWRLESAGPAFVATFLLVTAATTAVALLGARRMPLGALRVVALLTLAVLAGDVLTGSRLQLASIFGQNPVVGGRYYGLGNTSFALYGLATLVVVQWVATLPRLRRRLALPSAALVLVLALVIEGYPSLGADFGGPPGLLLGGLVVLASAAGIGITPVRVLLAGLAAAALTAGVALLDWLRPPEQRTHLGEFVQNLLDGQVGPVISRKIAQNLENLLAPPLVLITVTTTALGLLLWRSSWRPGPGAAIVLRAAATMSVIGFLVNDSGLVIPAFVALTLVPLVLADSASGKEGARTWPSIVEPAAS